MLATNLVILTIVAVHALRTPCILPAIFYRFNPRGIKYLFKNPYNFILRAIYTR